MSDWLDEVLKDRPVLSDHTRRMIAWAGELEFLHAVEDDHTGRTVKFRVVRLPEQMREAHPFAHHTRRRRNRAGTRFEAAFAEIDGAQELMVEIMLLNWSDGPQGATVTFLLDNLAEKHPFMGARRPSRDQAGTRWMATLVEKDDDEVIVRQDKRRRLEEAARRGKHQTLSNVAAMFTKNARFIEFLREMESSDVRWTQRKVDDWLKDTLGIKSKADLDSDGPEAIRPIAAFHRLRASFVDWQTANGYDPEEA